MKLRAIIALLAMLVFGGMSLALAQSTPKVTHEGGSHGPPAGCYNSYGRHVRC